MNRNKVVAAARGRQGYVHERGGVLHAFFPGLSLAIAFENICREEFEIEVDRFGTQVSLSMATVKAVGSVPFGITSLDSRRLSDFRKEDEDGMIELRAVS